MNIDDCKVIELPKICNPSGNLTFIEGKGGCFPFNIKRFFYLNDVPAGESRGAHAHRELHQFLVCLSGSFDVSLEDGTTQSKVHLNRPWKGLHIRPMIWAAEVDFSPGSVCLVLASDFYIEEDYFRDYGEFLKAVNK